MSRDCKTCKHYTILKSGIGMCMSWKCEYEEDKEGYEEDE